MRRLYLDAPDPTVHTSMVVARARRQTAPETPDAQGGKAEAAAAAAIAPAVVAGSEGDRVIGTGGDRKYAKVRAGGFVLSKPKTRCFCVHLYYYFPSLTARCFAERTDAVKVV